MSAGQTSLLGQVKSTLAGTYEYAKNNRAKSAAIALAFALVAVGAYFGIDEIIQNHEKIGAFIKHDVVQFLSDNQKRFEGAGILLGAGLTIYGVREGITWLRSGKKADTVLLSTGPAAARDPNAMDTDPDNTDMSND